jgi:N-acetylmuramoyl-L-alanine amidase
MSRPRRHKLLVDGIIIALLFWIAPRPGTRAPDADLVARESRSAHEPSLAQSLFDSANDLDQSLRGQSTESRTRSEYRHAIDAYVMVVRTGIDPDLSAESLAHAADLMREMADGSGDYAFYRQAIEAYRRVISEYPQSNLVAYSLLGIAQINEENLQDLDGAAAAYSEIVRHFPNSVMGREARAVLDRFDDELRARDAAPDVELNAAAPTADTRARLNNVRNFNGPEYARVVLDLSDGAKYVDRRIDGNRIGIQLDGAAVDPALQGRRFITQRSGLLKRIRVSDRLQQVGGGPNAKARAGAGQNGLCIEIEANGLYGYSAFRMSNPERIIIDLHSAKYAEGPAWRPSSAEASRSRQREVDTGEGAHKVGGQPGDGDRAGVAGPAPSSTPTPNLTTAPPVSASNAHTAADTATHVDAAGAVRIARDEKSAGSIRCIVIDPGHGGHDTGTIGSGGLREKDLVLDVARRLREYITRNYPDIEVALTRDSDRFIALEERTAIANSKRADLFISIHANSSPSKIASGVETFIQDPNRTPLAAKPKHEAALANRPEPVGAIPLAPTTPGATALAPAQRAATALAPASLAVKPGDDPIRDRAKAAGAAGGDHVAADTRTASAEKPEPMVATVSAGNRFGASRELAGFIQSSLVRGIGATSPRTAADRGVKHAAFAVLLGAAMPSVLAEVSFVSNRRDENLLQTAAFRDRIAASLFSGLSAYLKKNRPSPGPAKK